MNYIITIRLFHVKPITKGCRMQITIKLTCDNAAFLPETQPEIARILRKLAEEIEAGGEPDTIRDINGNVVGGLTVSD